MVNDSGALTGLGLLTGSYVGGGATVSETPAARAARKLFTTPATKAPWTVKTKADTSLNGILAKASTVRMMHSIVDAFRPSDAAGSDDVETSFITYRALDRLNALAKAGQQAGLSDAERSGLQKAFSKGLTDLRRFLADAPAQKLSLAFGPPSSTVKSAPAEATQDIGKFTGTGVVDDLDAAIPGLTGKEVLSITLASGHDQHDTVTVDLSTLDQQPPTLQQVAKAINDAVAAPASGFDYRVKFSVAKVDDKHYGLTMSSGSTRVSIDQAGAGDALTVVSSRTRYDAAEGAQIYRIADPATALDRQKLGEIVAIDRLATGAAQEKVKARDAATAGDRKARATDPATPLPTVTAGLTAQASVTASDGFTYVVGTTRGDLGTNRSDGSDDLFLSKVDSEGKIVWQHALGATGTAQGAAISLGAHGDIIVAGTVTGTSGDSGDERSAMLVARYDTTGEKLFATELPSSGHDEATAVVAAADGSIYVGGRTAVEDGGRAGYVAHLDANGKFVEQRSLGTEADRVNALAIDTSGNLLALTRKQGEATLRRLDATALTNELGSADLGAADARALAVAADGRIAVVGATSQALPDNAAFGTDHGSDGFVTRLKSDLTGASTTYLGGEGEDQADSVTFVGAALYVGGRTTGNLGGTREGKLDGFVARIDAASGAIGALSQFGSGGGVADPVIVAAAKGGNTVLGALGLHRGALNGEIATSLSTQFGLADNDSFKVQLDNGVAQSITIKAGETMTSLRLKIQQQLGSDAVMVTTTRDADNHVQLSISVRQGHTLSLTGGPKGRDALAKLGIAPTRVHSDAARKKSDPKVLPGGSFGLSLSDTLNIATVDAAKGVGKTIEAAISMTQTAYRSLYWDKTKATQASGIVDGGGTARQQAQLASYKLALSRLGGGA